MIGRDGELRLLVDTVTSSAAVTVVGAGGVGKTLLAAAVGRSLAKHFRGGVCTVWLADLYDPDLVLAEVSAAVAQTRSGSDGAAGLIEWLADREMLLVLDNAEHVTDAVADLVAELISALPDLHILVTSREPLLVVGETVFVLHPLAVTSHAENANTAATSHAAQLFIERLRRRDREFQPDDEQRNLIDTICRRLDGLPLAIELAAARAASLGVARVAAKLSGSAVPTFRSGRERDPRHADLRSVFEWSEALLDERERALLRRLSVFAGGFTLSALDAVIGGEFAFVGYPDGDPDLDPDSILTSLVEKSLVEREHGSGRYRLLETIRSFAGERLVAAGESDLYRERHSCWVLGLATEVGAGVTAGPERPWLEQLGPELDNLRVALRRVLDGGNALRALAVTAGLPIFWWALGQHREGYEWISECLDRATGAPDELRAAALFGMAFLRAHDTDDWRGAGELLDQAIGIVAREPPILGYLLCLRGKAHVLVGSPGKDATRVGAGDPSNVDTALALTRRGLAILETASDPWGTAFAVWNVGFVLERAGRLDEARECFQRMADIQVEHGSRLELTIAWKSLADIAERTGDHARARGLYLQALDVRRELGASRLGYVHGSLSESLIALARCEIRLGRPLEAQAHLSEALPLAREMHDFGLIDACLALEERVHAPAVEGEFLRDQEGWRLRYGSVDIHVPDSKGMRHLSVLLARPGVPISALSLTALTDGNPVEDADAGPVLDGTALRSYRARLSDLLAEIEAADVAGDVHRSAMAEAERTAVLAELSRGTGLGGRARRAGSTAERARLNATRTTRDAITRIARRCPSLGEHLATTVRTGHRCSYEPDVPISWRASAG